MDGISDTADLSSSVLQWNSRLAKVSAMKPGWIFKDAEVITLPSLTAVIEKEKKWFVSLCPELGVASQGRTRKEAYSMLAEAVESWLEAASANEIKRRLRTGASVQPLDLAHA